MRPAWSGAAFVRVGRRVARVRRSNLRRWGRHAVRKKGARGTRAARAPHDYCCPNSLDITPMRVTVLTPPLPAKRLLP